MDTVKLAEILNGREYGEEITKEQEEVAKECGLIVIFGSSDDLIEIRGAINEEIDSCNWTSFYIRNNEFIKKEDAIKELQNPVSWYENYFKSLVEKDLKNAKSINSNFNKDGYTWIITTNIPHETFEIFEGKEKFCRGIVIDINDL